MRPGQALPRDGPSAAATEAGSAAAELDALRATCRHQAQVIDALGEAVSALRGAVASAENAVRAGGEIGSLTRSAPAEGPAAGRRLNLVERLGAPDAENADRGLEIHHAAHAGVDESLARVVETVERQRETLERDLHDGVQQRLVAERIRLAIATELGPGDARLREVLSEVGDGLDEAIDELREVASGIHPHVLTERGLVAALEHVARAAAVPVAVTSSGVTRHPADLELAIYYCCREAIQNASKHGGASVRISIALHQDADSVGFEVTDDGPGFDVANEAAGGRGLQHMRDRIALLGGRLSIVSQAGVGTVVSGAISPGEAFPLSVHRSAS